MKKTILTAILLTLSVAAAYATGSGRSTPGTSGPDAASTSILLGAASAGLLAARKFLKK